MRAPMPSCQPSEPLMSHRSITVLALVVTGALAATTVSMPTAFAADDENHVQSTVTPNSDTPAPEATQPRRTTRNRVPPHPPTPRTRPGMRARAAPRNPPDDTPTTIIVQLEDGNVGIPWYNRIFGLSTSMKHETVKDRIETAVESSVPGSDVTDVLDYTKAFDGFVIQAPASSLETIKATQGRQGGLHRAPPQAAGRRGRHGSEQCRCREPRPEERLLPGDDPCEPDLTEG